mmetsp:Transcript_970/g.2527  ORF Transcript_970/g.2527 Transcript_970/m.2527 type:complete len:716 (-) Transcript_970:255-2402(-)
MDSHAKGRKGRRASLTLSALSRSTGTEKKKKSPRHVVPSASGEVEGLEKGTDSITSSSAPKSGGNSRPTSGAVLDALQATISNDEICRNKRLRRHSRQFKGDDSISKSNLGEDSDHSRAKSAMLETSSSPTRCDPDARPMSSMESLRAQSSDDSVPSVNSTPASSCNSSRTSLYEDKVLPSFIKKATALTRREKDVTISRPMSFRDNTDVKSQVDQLKEKMDPGEEGTEPVVNYRFTMAPEKEAADAVAAVGEGDGDGTQTWADGSDLKFIPEDLENSSCVFPRIKAASLERLVEYLTHESYADPVLKKTFLITYRSFTTSSDFMEALAKRFGLSPGSLDSPPDEEKEGGNENANNGSSLGEGDTKVLQKRRIKVVGIVKSWIEYYFYDFGRDASLMKKLENFLQHVTKLMAGAGPHLRRMLDKGVARAMALGQLSDKAAAGMGSYKALKKEAGEGAMFWADKPAEIIAEQLTLLESEMYCAITSRECIAWLKGKGDKSQECPVLAKLVDFFNQVSWSVTTAVCSTLRKSRRVRLLEKMIDVMAVLFRLNNLNGVFEIMSGLNNASVRRLKQTFAELSKEKKELFEKFEDVMSHHKSFSKYRTHLHTIAPPCVPYVGIYLTDLTFLEDGNPDNVDGLINFLKRTRVAKVIIEIEQYQEPYPKLELDQAVRDELLDMKALSEECCYQMSKYAEPKNVTTLLAELVEKEDKVRFLHP